MIARLVWKSDVQFVLYRCNKLNNQIQINMNEWNIELTDKERENIVISSITDESFFNNFGFINQCGDYIENVVGKNKHQICFFDNDCLWMIEHLNSLGSFTLKCLSKPNDDFLRHSINYLWTEIMASASDGKCVHFWHLETTDTYFVEYFDKCD